MEIPHKLAYLNGGGRAWRAVCEDPRYDLGRRELASLAHLMSQVVPRLPQRTVNVLHLGPGTGREVAIVVDAVGPANIRQYGVVDISVDLLGLAGAVVADRLGPERMRRFEHDLNRRGLARLTQTLRNERASCNLLVLAGNGGILSDLSCLGWIEEAMEGEDRLLVILEFYEPARERDILDQFRIPTILNLFGRCLAPLGVCDPQPTEFEVVYSPETALLEIYFIPAPSRRALQISDRLRLFASFRPTPERLRATLESFQFQVLCFETFSEERCCGAICCVSEGRR